PERGDQLGPVVDEPVVPLALGEPADEPVDGAGLLADGVLVDLDRGRLAEHVLELERAADRGGQVEGEREQLRDRLDTGTAGEEDRVGLNLAEGDPERPVLLRKLGHGDSGPKKAVHRSMLVTGPDEGIRETGRRRPGCGSAEWTGGWNELRSSMGW